MGDDFTKAALADKKEAWVEGVEAAKRYIPGHIEMPPYDEPYLAYQWCLGFSQHIANHGRALAGIGGKSQFEPDKKGARA